MPDETPPEFATVDWADYRASGVVFDRRTAGFALSLVALAAVFAYDYLFVPRGIVLVGSLDPSRLDWLFALSLVVLAFYGVAPLLASPDLTRSYLAALRDRPLALVAVGYFAVFTVVAAVGPEVVGPPGEAHFAEIPARGSAPNMPPVGASVPLDSEKVLYCTARRVGDRCVGTWAHPLGTTQSSADVLAYLVWGTRSALKLSVITGVLLVPLSTAVGTAAAYYGGRVDDVLTAYLDLQQLVPAVLVYLLVQFFYGPSLFAIAVLFALLDWDRIARQIRNDALRKTGSGYVRAAESAGSRSLDTVRRHVVPNVSNTIVSATTRQIPFVILAEVAVSYIGINSYQTRTWGTLLNLGLVGPTSELFMQFPSRQFNWWSTLFPTLLLLVTLAMLVVLGRALRDVLDPYGG